MMTIPPTEAMLIAEARTFLRGDSQRYKKLRKEGDLEEIIALKIAAAKDHAATLMGQGVFESQAWFWAIKEKILEQEAD